jgi:hypothetical protein
LRARYWRSDLKQMFHGVAHHFLVGSTIGIDQQCQNGNHQNHFNPHPHFFLFKTFDFKNEKSPQKNQIPETTTTT